MSPVLTRVAWVPVFALHQGLRLRVFCLPLPSALGARFLGATQAWKGKVCVRGLCDVTERETVEGIRARGSLLEM